MEIPDQFKSRIFTNRDYFFLCLLPQPTESTSRWTEVGVTSAPCFKIRKEGVYKSRGCSVCYVEPRDLSIAERENMTDGLVLEAVGLSLQRVAVEIEHRLDDLGNNAIVAA